MGSELHRKLQFRYGAGKPHILYSLAIYVSRLLIVDEGVKRPTIVGCLLAPVRSRDRGEVGRIESWRKVELTDVECWPVLYAFACASACPISRDVTREHIQCPTGAVGQIESQARAVRDINRI